MRPEAAESGWRGSVRRWVHLFVNGALDLSPTARLTQQSKSCANIMAFSQISAGSTLSEPVSLASSEAFALRQPRELEHRFRAFPIRLSQIHRSDRNGVRRIRQFEFHSSIPPPFKSMMTITVAGAGFRIMAKEWWQENGTAAHSFALMLLPSDTVVSDTCGSLEILRR